MAPHALRQPRDIAVQARRGLGRAAGDAASKARPRTDAWKRDTFNLPRDDARRKAREMFDRFPRAAYLTEVESWRVLEGDRIEFTMRRLPTAD
jgi:hypothetical protein